MSDEQHQAQWGPERPLPPPVSLASQSHHEKPPEVTCTSRGNPGFPASTRERPRETFFNTSRGHIPLPWLPPAPWILQPCRPQIFRLGANKGPRAARDTAPDSCRTHRENVLWQRMRTFLCLLALYGSYRVLLTPVFLISEVL